jgi:hypothetical protein
LKDIELCGADINLSHVRMATEHLDMWESLIGTRKSPLKQASIIGLGTLFRVATRSITLNELIDVVCKRIGIQGRAIVWQNAEPCMDVDKPHQLELMREDMAKQQRKENVRAKRAASASNNGAAKKSTSKSSDGAKKVAALAAARKITKPKAPVKKK